MDVPRYYTWKNKSWNRRKQEKDVTVFPGVKDAHILGRVYTVNPHQGKCFYLRLLLHNIKGSLSFAHLGTVEGNLYSSFHEVCLRLGLLEDDNQYQLAMQEAAVSNSAASLGSLFAVILTWCEPSNPLDINEHHKESMAKGFLHQLEFCNMPVYLVTFSIKYFDACWYQYVLIIPVYRVCLRSYKNHQ